MRGISLLPPDIHTGGEGAADVVPHAEDGTRDGGKGIGSEMEDGKGGGET